MPGEPVVGHQKIGIDKHRHRLIVADHRRDKRPRLSPHRLDEILVKAILGVEPDVGLVATEVSQIEPVVGEVPDELFKPRVVDEPVRLRSKHLRLAQLPDQRFGEQLRIRPRVPEKIGEPRSQGRLVVGSAWILKVEHVGRAEQRPVADQHRLRKLRAGSERIEHEPLKRGQFLGRQPTDHRTVGKLPQQLAGSRITRRLRGDGITLGQITHNHRDRQRRTRSRSANRQVAEEHPMGFGRPGLGRQRAGDLERLEGDPRMAARRHGGKAVGRRTAVNIACQRHGQPEQAVFDRLALLQKHGRLVVAALRRNIEESTHRLHVAGNVGTRGRPGPKRHRHRLRCRHEHKVFHLVHRAGVKPHAIDAVASGDKPTRIAVVGPVGGAENRALDLRIVGLGLVDLLGFLGEKPCLRLAERLSPEELRRYGRKHLRRLRCHAFGNRRTQRGVGGVEVGLQLDPGKVEALCRLVEAVPRAVLGQPIADVEVRQPENVAERVLILTAIEAAQGHPAVVRDVGPIGGLDGPRKCRDECRPPVVGQVAGIRRHLPLGNAVVHERKPLSDGTIAEIGADRRNGEPALGGALRVAIEARCRHERVWLMLGRRPGRGLRGGHAPRRGHDDREQSDEQAQRHRGASAAAVVSAQVFKGPCPLHPRTSVTIWAARITAAASRTPSASQSRGAGAVIQIDAIALSLASKIGAPRQWWPSIVSPRSIA